MISSTCADSFSSNVSATAISDVETELYSCQPTDDRIENIPSENSTRNHELSVLESDRRIVSVFNLKAVESEEGIVVFFSEIHQFVRIGESVSGVKGF